MSTTTEVAPTETPTDRVQLCDVEPWHPDKVFPPATHIIDCACGRNRVAVCRDCLARWHGRTAVYGQPSCDECGQPGPYLIVPL